LCLEDLNLFFFEPLCFFDPLCLFEPVGAIGADGTFDAGGAVGLDDCPPDVLVGLCNNL